MPATITYPVRGRGAWPTAGGGGTLNDKGTGPGRYYTLALPDPDVGRRIGRTGFVADRDSLPVSVDLYGTYRAVAAIQVQLGVKADQVDGIFGPITRNKLLAWQTARGLFVDGVYGPASSRAMWEPLIAPAAQTVDPTHASDLVRLVTGHIGIESVWDPGAVGGTDPTDVGLAQIHLPAHTDVTAAQALDPVFSVPWMARFCDDNLRAAGYDIELGAAMYNLGQGGGRAWEAAGRPTWWSPSTGKGQATEPPKPHTYRNVDAYIAKVLAG